MRVELRAEDSRTTSFIPIDPAKGVKITDDDGTQWIVRRSITTTAGVAGPRLEIMLVPGTGPNGESDLVVRPANSNVINVEAGGW